jgi:hypothetical protein
MVDLKAGSQNLMHSSLLVTDAIYSVLSEDDVGARIASMSGDLNATGDKSEQELVELMQEMLSQIKTDAM